MYRILSGIFILLSVAGCMSSPIIVSENSSQALIDDPPLGEVVTRGLGETLVAKGITTSGEALVIREATQFNKKEGEKSIMTCAITAFPGTYFMRGTWDKDGVKAKCFGPVSLQNSKADGTTNLNCPGQLFSGDVCVESSGIFFAAHLSARFPLEQDHDHLKLVQETITHETNFVKELVYNGRTGDSLKFIYREFSDGTARPAFTQEVQYDLAVSRTIGFKKLRMEILEATNTEITYKIEENFE